MSGALVSLYRKITLFSVLGLQANQDKFELVGLFYSEEAAKEAAKHFQKAKVEQVSVFREEITNGTALVFTCGEQVIPSTTWAEHRKRQALSKLTPEERKLLGLE